MKVSEFIEWLKTQDQEATVQVLVHGYHWGYGEGHFWEFQDLDPHHLGQFLNGKIRVGKNNA